jgi:hypothetical protein
MAAATTTVDAATGALVIAWLAPEDHGSPILAYEIEVRDQVGSGWHTVAECLGTDATILAARTCSIAMPTLTVAPLSYTLGTLIVVRARA